MDGNWHLRPPDRDATDSMIIKEEEELEQGDEASLKALLSAICRNILKEKLQIRLQLKAVMELESQKKLPDVEEFHDMEEVRMVTETLAWDDLTGMHLDRGKVKEARQKEMDYVHKKEVWLKSRRSRAIANGWKIIKIRWIDINKGDDENPIYRSRAVGKSSTTELSLDSLQEPHPSKR